MPAKSVVIEDLWKFQGERHELVTPGSTRSSPAERAGVGSTPSATPSSSTADRCRSSASPASRRRTRPASSSFRPSYNMAVNLVRSYTPEQAHRLLNSSFAQFLATEASSPWSVRASRTSRPRALPREPRCDLGDFEEYWRYLEKARRLREEDRRARDQGRRDDLRRPSPGFGPATSSGCRARDVEASPSSCPRATASRPC